MVVRPKEPIVFTVEQMSELLGINRCNAYRLVREGKLPAVRIGKARWVIPKKRLEEFLGN